VPGEAVPGRARRHPVTVPRLVAVTALTATEAGPHSTIHVWVDKVECFIFQLSDSRGLL